MGWRVAESKTREKDRRYRKERGKGGNKGRKDEKDRGKYIVRCMVGIGE